MSDGANTMAYRKQTELRIHPEDVRKLKTNLGKMIRAGIMDDQMRRRGE